MTFVESVEHVFSNYFNAEGRASPQSIGGGISLPF